MRQDTPTLAHHRYWPRGVPHALRVPQVTLNHYLEVNAVRYPDKPAIVFCGQTLSYAELLRQVNVLAGYLQHTLGVARGDRVLLMSQNGPQFVVAYYAALRSGAAIVPVNPMSTTPELGFYVRDSGARVAMVACDLLTQVLPLLGQEGDASLKHLLVHSYADGLSQGPDDSLPEAMRGEVPVALPAGVHRFADALAAAHAPLAGESSPDDLAVLPYTSGTTGHPKGCCHSHRTLLASNLASQVWRGLHGDAVFLCVAPLFHMLGMQNGMNMPLTLGATIVMMPRWNAAQAVELVERHRVTVWTAPPAMVIDFFAQPDAQTRDLSSLALLSGGGAAMPEAVATLLSERFGLQYNEAYGLSETAAFLHANPVARGKRQCLGMPTQGVDSRIVDPVSLQELPPGEVGELVTRGEQVMSSYWCNPQADAAAFIELDGRRYFRTGDLAHVDEEGYFFMRDRLKRMVNASGFKVWPAEVESALYEHPAIHEACIVGVPDERRGETVKALIVLKPEHRGHVSEQDIIDWSRQRMAVYKAPRLVRFMESLPKSGTGKILWRELQAAEQGSASPITEPSPEESGS
ncbi:fatty-acyl-CoA synthase [Hydrogenophaga palleronii]|uniref:Fatty-acyl-CoA synthase n=1 Tax=Hydrogenophaga palleronii TaxID=65655 RepID=A0ABU1WTU0_9BURK|nr:long-chain-fatty-acid--CoA ligase [Hydrogenophaga palleronii]MDR7152721.1 fatty-acyl-CoA synthase [Hydrogenophaga palleronii]